MIERRALLAVALSLAAGAAGAVRSPVGADAAIDPAQLRIDEARYLGAAIPDVPLRTPEGERMLRAAMAGAPAIVVLGYFGCQGVCPTTLALLAEALREVRRPHRVLVLSFDTRDTIETLAVARARLDPAPAHWTFGLLAAEDAAQLTAALGYRYYFVERERVFAHPNVLVFASEAGRVTRFLYGLPQRRDIELALAESSAGVARAGDVWTALQLACFSFDPTRSRYVLHPLLAFGGAGLGVLALAAAVAVAWRPISSKGAHS